MKTGTVSLLSLSLFVAHLSHAFSAIDCKQKISVKGTKYDFSALDSIHRVYQIDKSAPPAVYNTTWSVNICRPIPIDKNIEKEEQCPSGTNSETASERCEATLLT